jgi:hypothetical protein
MVVNEMNRENDIGLSEPVRSEGSSKSPDYRIHLRQSSY